MKTLVKNKGILATIAVFILAMFLYNFFSASDALPVSIDLSAPSIGADLLQIYDKLQQVTLDQAVFSSAGYRELTDFSESIPPQPTGRPNPFDLIGRN